MPFSRCNLGSGQRLIDDPVLGQGRDPLAPLQDVITDEGDIVAPVDPRYLGFWLTGLFGDRASNDNGDGSHEHEFISGGETLPSYTIEVGMPKVPAFFRHVGVERQISERKEAGLPTDGLPDLDHDADRDGFYQSQLIRELAVRHIMDWTGIELQGGPAPPTSENIGAVMNLYPIGERFFQKFMLQQVLLNAAKNGSGLSAAGISSQAEGPNTVVDAETTNRHVATEPMEATDSAAPTMSTV
jgi:hypothetical protein